MFATYLIIALIYTGLLLYLLRGIQQLPTHNGSDAAVQHRFSIVIPFRNEAHNLPGLLETLEALNYPRTHFELLLVDDASEDTSLAIVNAFIAAHPDISVTLLQNQRQSPSPKKDAITTAITQAKHEWILTTDADCFVPELWLKAYNEIIISKSPNMIVAPVSYTNDGSFFQQFQLLDFLSLQSATMAGFGIKRPFLCNGANLCYKASIFKALSGFEGNTQIASGDDIFLMEKLLKKFPETLVYLKTKTAIVYTQPQATFKELFHQRVRWAAKSSHYDQAFSKWVGLLIFISNAALVSGLIFASIGLLTWEVLVGFFFIKLVLDYRFIRKASRFLQSGFCLKYYLMSAFLYPLFSVAVVVYTMRFGYKWKGRQFKK